MAAGAAGPHGDPALEVKDQELEAATTLPLVEVADSALDYRWSRNLVRNQTRSTCSKDMVTS